MLRDLKGCGSKLIRFFWAAQVYIRAGTELTWDYSYQVDSVPGKKLYCHCGAKECKGRLL